MANPRIILQLLIFLVLGKYCLGFDYFQFVQQWPKSSCNHARRINPCLPVNAPLPVNFTIHGLWPDNLVGAYLKKCPPVTPFSIQDQTMLIQLTTSWPNVEDLLHNDKFWNYQWQKHGTCSLLPQPDFFNLALFWKDQYDLLNILENAGILPGGAYQASQIIGAISAQTSKIPDLRCNTNTTGHNQLQEISICLDMTGSGVVDCPPSRGARSCRTFMHFPA